MLQNERLHQEPLPCLSRLHVGNHRGHPLSRGNCQSLNAAYHLLPSAMTTRSNSHFRQVKPTSLLTISKISLLEVVLGTLNFHRKVCIKKVSQLPGLCGSGTLQGLLWPRHTPVQRHQRVIVVCVPSHAPWGKYTWHTQP